MFDEVISPARHKLMMRKKACRSICCGLYNGMRSRSFFWMKPGNWSGMRFWGYSVEYEFEVILDIYLTPARGRC